MLWVSLRVRDGPFFPYGFLNSNNVKIWVSGWVKRNGLFKLQGKKICTPKNQCFLCRTIKKVIVYFWRRILVDSTLSEHLNHYICNNVHMQQCAYATMCIARVFWAFISTLPLRIHEISRPLNCSNSPVSFIVIWWLLLRGRVVTYYLCHKHVKPLRPIA